MSSCRWKRCTASFSDIPPADELVFAGWFRGEELFPLRLLLAARRGQNLLFPARPRNQSGILPSRYPENHRKYGQGWAAPDSGGPPSTAITSTAPNPGGQGLPIDQY